MSDSESVDKVAPQEQAKPTLKVHLQQLQRHKHKTEATCLSVALSSAQSTNGGIVLKWEYCWRTRIYAALRMAEMTGVPVLQEAIITVNQMVEPMQPNASGASGLFQTMQVGGSSCSS